ncbi:hypothetical protein [Vibrio coralliilyticus]|uniref:hypothetical protein n=1 Tax=Vibrio coralliilyticus TaxID=190893 RepID=UPI000BAC2135|nr:hypothetical protein [Vibrio coralliilyticus]PAW04389.1 hypothetical protein CKJ79_06570 [Vibrio coralliilyticus]
MPYQYTKSQIVPLFLFGLICLYFVIPQGVIDLLFVYISKGVYLLILAVMYFLGHWSAKDKSQPKTRNDTLLYPWAFVGLFSVMIEW